MGGFPQDFALLRDRRIIRDLRAEFGDKTFEDMQIPLYMVAADMQAGDKVILESGDIVCAIRASIGIPVIFGPSLLDGKWLMDGGCVDPFPIDVAIRENCDLIIGMGFHNPYSHEIRSFQSYILQTTNIIIDALQKSQLAFDSAVHHSEIVPMILDFEEHVGVFDTHRVPDLVEAGEAEARKHLPYLLKLLEHMRDG